MKLSTVTIPSVEMTRQEYEESWDNFWGKTIEGKKITHWNQNDGNNELLLEGEQTYRVVVITKA